MINNRLIEKSTVLATVLIVATAGVALLGGCASTVAEELTATKTPSWVIRGSVNRTVEGERVFEGVGSIVGVRNLELANQAADNRARGQLVATFDRFGTDLFRGYLASTDKNASPTSKTATSNDQYIAERVKLLSANALPHAVVASRWTDPVDGAVYSLAQLELKRFESALSDIKELSDSERRFLAENAKTVFDRQAAAPAVPAP